MHRLGFGIVFPIMISTKDLSLVPLTFVNNLSWWPDVAVNVMNSHPSCE